MLNERRSPFVTKWPGKQRIFKSFEEAREAESMDEARNLPIQGIIEKVGLILRVYGVKMEQPRDRRKKLRINIIMP